MSMQVEALANSRENKAAALMDFKNSFAWLTGMENLIFDFNIFFWSGHFLNSDILKIDQKMTGAKKFIGSKN